MTVAPHREALDFEAPEEVIDALRRAGHRVSTPARLVLEALFAADGPVSAESIAEGMSGSTPLELTSVYRNLERLEGLGVVSHLHVGHGPGLYALARGRDREYLVCERCGRVDDVEPEALDPVRKVLRKRFGYAARFSHFPVHGHCSACVEAIGDDPPHSHEHPE